MKPVRYSYLLATGFALVNLVPTWSVETTVGLGCHWRLVRQWHPIT